MASKIPYGRPRNSAAEGSQDSRPAATVPFEVVRQGEYVFEPFMGSLIQIPEVRMQRAQSSEFFLPQAPLHTEQPKQAADEVLLWERPNPASREPAPAAPSHADSLSTVPDKRKKKAKKTAKDQESPRFYQPPTVRFFDPVAASAEAEEGALPDLPGPRESNRLSPELKAAILRIDEQRRQLQQQDKQEKPAKEKKRGALKSKPPRKVEMDPPVEIVKSRDVALTERAARWEEISKPPLQRPIEDRLTGAVEQPATPAASTHVALNAEPAGIVDRDIIVPDEIQAAEVVPAAASTGTAELLPDSVPEQQPSDAFPVSATVEKIPESSFAAVTQPEQENWSHAPEEAEVEQSGEAPAGIPITPDLRERETVLPPEFALAEKSVPADEPAAPFNAIQPGESSPVPDKELSVEERFALNLRFALSDEDLREGKSPEVHEVTMSPAPTSPAQVADASEVASDTVMPPPFSETEVVPSPTSFAADETETMPIEKERSESPSPKRVRGIGAAFARMKRAQPSVEPADAPISMVEEGQPQRNVEKLPLATRFQRWLGGEAATLDGNRRRANRMTMPGLVAFYWSGGSPRPHEIVNISKTGFYLKTREFWSIETLVRMTLQRPSSETKPKAESISVLARVVRIDEDGVGHEFVTTEALTHARSMDVMPSHGTDTRELDRFLQIR